MSLSRRFLTRILPVAFVSLCAVGSVPAQTPSGKSSAAKLGSPSILQQSDAPLPDPGTLFNLSASVGETYRFLVIGSATGAIWGDGVYTSDSVLAAAAVHAGLLGPGEQGIVTVEVIEGLSSYDGSSKHGVTSLPYGAWETAYRLVSVEPVAGPVVLPDPGDLSAYRGQNGTILQFEVTGRLDGSVWGDGTYTDDSDLGTAAVHAGILSDGQSGVVSVEILPGQSEYAGAQRNGVASGSYASWDGSYRILPADEKSSKSKLAN